MTDYSSDPTTDKSIPDPDQVLYRDKSDAERAANARGCSGTHPHKVDGQTHHMPCSTHKGYHDSGGDAPVKRNTSTGFYTDSGSGPGSGSGSYAGTKFDLTTTFGDTDTGSSNLLRPRSDASPVEFGRDPSTGEFDDVGGDPVPFERNDDTGQIGPDPFAVGNFGEFNSPYDTSDEEEDKYG